VPGSVDVLAAELSDAKSHLIRIAAYHALASQADETALTVLQKSVASRLADGSQESQAQENAVAVHGLLALGELPNSSSLALLESVAKNPANSVSVRSTAFTSIAAIGGVEAQQPLRRALKDESDESLLVYIARALAVVGEASDAPACLEKAATVSDSYTKSELQRAARALQTKR
jgi:HEAT repeat protein